MPGILTGDIVQEAIGLALPFIQGVASKYHYKGGPHGVVIVVSSPLIESPIVHIMGDELGLKETWQERWGCDYELIARQKLQGALRTGQPNRELFRAPWRMQIGDSIYYGAVAEDTDLAVAVSGLEEYADEACAWTVLNAIAMICADRFKKIRNAEEVNTI